MLVSSRFGLERLSGVEQVNQNAFRSKKSHLDSVFSLMISSGKFSSDGLTASPFLTMTCSSYALSASDNLENAYVAPSTSPREIKGQLEGVLRSKRKCQLEG